MVPNEQNRATPAVLPLFGILTLFWIYVALSNVLYAHSMNASFATMSMGDEGLFAPWDVRVLQHAILYPVLLVCAWSSLRIGWQPLAYCVPMQLLIGIAFATLATPSLVAGEILLHSMPLHHFLPAHFRDWLKGPEASLWIASGTNMFLTYGFGLALITGFSTYHRFRDAQSHLSTLQNEWSTARLSALRMQLSPHTLFNLLHTIHGEIAWDPKAAQSMVVQLGDLLRRLLNAGEQDFSRLADELEFVRLYLNLQQRRFPDRLAVELPAKESLPAVWVPSLILQPLVENAVVHGMAGHEGRVTIRVSIETNQDALHLIVCNTAVDRARAPVPGIGIRNVRERLEVQFGGRASLVSEAGANGEWCAKIRMPLLREGPPEQRLPATIVR